MRKMLWHGDLFFGPNRVIVTKGDNFTAHHFSSWEESIPNFVRQFDDDFFDENYLVLFTVPSTTLLTHSVQRVLDEGDIIMYQVPEVRYAITPGVHYSWHVVIELQRGFRPHEFTVVRENPWYPTTRPRWWRSSIEVHVFQLPHAALYGRGGETICFGFEKYYYLSPCQQKYCQPTQIKAC